VRQPPDGRPAGVGEPVVVDAKDRRHQRRVRHLEVKEPLRGIEDFTGHPIERHVLEVLLGVVPAAVHVFEAPPGGDGLLRPASSIRYPIVQNPRSRPFVCNDFGSRHSPAREGETKF
jgi:hypothetical protein